MNKPIVRRIARGSAALIPFACLAGSAVAMPEAQSAVWRTQDIRFHYRGQLTVYDCASLELKVRQLLVALGAHPVTRVEPQSCNVVHLPNASTQVASMRIRLVSPALATQVPAVEAAASATRSELLRHLGIDEAPSGTFTATWQRIDVAAIEPLNLSSGDCELLSQLGAQVVPHLAVRIESRNRLCSSSPQRLTPPRLKVTALVAAALESYRADRG